MKGLKMRKWLSCALAAMLAMQTSLAGTAQAAKPGGLPLIRDSEIEELMRVYTRPIFKAAGINEGAVRVYLIQDSSINAFVAGGQRIFINTGLLVQAKTPNQVIGVLAHETGHISGGHLARMGQQIDKASTTAIIAMLLGAAATVGGVAAGQDGAAKAGQGLLLGSQQLVQRNLLAYARAQEASADQAALKYLNATQQSGKGMLELFQVLANQSLGSLRNVNPYVLSHPMPLDRIRTLEQNVKASPYYDKADEAGLLLRHKLIQAKLVGFTEGTQQVFRRYPKSDNSLPARYARAIAAFRVGDLNAAMPDIEALLEAQPANPYFWELKGQALLEGGRPAQAVPALQQAVKLAPNAGLIQILLAQALLNSGTGNGAQALQALQLARRTEAGNAQLWRQMALAYGQTGDIARAELSTAEAALLSGDREVATEKAKSALKAFPEGSPEWLRANDILNFTAQKKG